MFYIAENGPLLFGPGAEVQTDSDTETTNSARNASKNKDGLPVLHNGVVSVKELSL